MTPVGEVTPRATVRMLWALVRLATAGLLAAAVVTQFLTTYQLTLDKGRDVATTLQNFFSFFTILSNCLGAIVMLIGGLWLLIRGSHAQWEPQWLSFAFVSVGTYMVTTGIVYNLLLRGYVLEQGATVVWANEVLHLIGPALFLLDLIFRIARRPLHWSAMGVAVIFPIAWCIYTLVRGEHVTSPVTGESHWYPYPFLNPYLVPNGYVGVGLYIAGISVAILAVAGLAVWATRVGRGDPAEDGRDPTTDAEDPPVAAATTSSLEVISPDNH